MRDLLKNNIRIDVEINENYKGMNFLVIRCH